jgi:hypothetical protein
LNSVKDFEIGAVIANPKAKAHAYIIRHVLNHLTRSSGADSMQQFALLSRDEQFQQARRLLSLREEGLERFYHGEITREQAQELLMTNPQPGSFLLRYTSHKECYCASFIESIDSSTQVPKFRHFLLHNIGVNQYAIVPKAEITSTTRIYPDLVSIVEEYQLKGRLRAAIPRLTPLNREIFTDTIEAPSQTVPAILTTSGQLPPPLSSPPLSPVPDISTL